VVWETNLLDQRDLELTAAPLAIKDQIIVGGSGGDRGIRPWVVALDAKSGKPQWKTHSVPAPGEPGSETWKDGNNAWQTGGGSFYVTGSYDPATNLTIGAPVIQRRPMTRPTGPATISIRRARSLSMPPTARSGGTTSTRRTTIATMTRPAPTSSSTPRLNGEDRKILSHAGRNGFEYIFDRIQTASSCGRRKASSR